jgi:hypothetical protein
MQKTNRNHLIPNGLVIVQEETMKRKYERLKLGGGQAYKHSGDCRMLNNLRHNLLLKPALTDVLYRAQILFTVA